VDGSSFVFIYKNKRASASTSVDEDQSLFWRQAYHLVYDRGSHGQAPEMDQQDRSYASNAEPPGQGHGLFHVSWLQNEHKDEFEEAFPDVEIGVLELYKKRR